MSEKMEARIAEMQAELKAAMQLLDDSREKVADAGKRLSCELRYHAGLEAERQLLASGLGDPEGVLRKVTDERDQQQAWIEDLRKAIREAESVLDRASIPGGAEVPLAVRVQRCIDHFRQDLQRAAAEVQNVAGQLDAAVVERDAARVRVQALENDLAWSHEGISLVRPELERVTSERDQIQTKLDKTLEDAKQWGFLRAALGAPTDFSPEHLVDIVCAMRRERDALEKDREAVRSKTIQGCVQDLRMCVEDWKVNCGLVAGIKEKEASGEPLLEILQDEVSRVHALLDVGGIAGGILIDRVRLLARKAVEAADANDALRRAAWDKADADEYQRGLAAGVKACAAALRDRVAQAPQPGFEAPQHSTAVMLDCAAYLEREVKSV